MELENSQITITFSCIVYTAYKQRYINIILEANILLNIYLVFINLPMFELWPYFNDVSIMFTKSTELGCIK